MAVGSKALDALVVGVGNTAMGAFASQANNGATSTVAVGSCAGAGASCSSSSFYNAQGYTVIGYQAGQEFITGSDYNTLIGYLSGRGITSGARNTLIGNSTISASYNQITTGSNNIAIGNDVAVASSTLNNQLNIGNLIYGTALDGTGATVSTGNIGIGTSSPSAKFTVGATLGSQLLVNSTGNATSTSIFSALATFTNTTITGLLNILNETITGTLNVASGVFRAPYSTSPTIATNGDFGVDSTSGQVKYFDSTVKVLGNGNFYKTWTYATSTAWTGTTTMPLGTAYVGETWNGVQCFTDAGTVNVDFGDGTNFTNATTSKALNPVPTHTFTVNNTFTAGKTRYIRMGTPVSSPTRLSCTVSLSITAD